MFEVFTVYRTLPEFYCEADSEGEAEEIVADLKRSGLPDDAYYMPA